ncbi:MAG: DUF5011 domain-containing protein [Fibrobacteria bacterium]|nr:DUF5011 domain-containing protein [Fibrobacteria bacterium]
MTNPGVLDENTDSVEVRVAYEDKEVILYQGVRGDEGYEGPYEKLVRDFERGMIILIIKEFDSNGSLISSKSYTYEESGNGIKVVYYVTVVPEVLELKVDGGDTALFVKVYPDKGNTGVHWQSTNMGVARVSSAGVLTPVGVGNVLIIATADVDSTSRDTARVTISKDSVKLEKLTIIPGTLKLYAGGARDTLMVSVVPEDFLSSLKWTSTDSSVVTIDMPGVVGGLQSGTASIIVSEISNPAINDTCDVIVVSDAPVIQAGPDTIVLQGSSISFPVSLAQDYGRFTVLKWDLEGDGVWDDSLMEFGTSLQFDTTFQYLYSTPGVFIAKFEVRDSEGNMGTAFRRIQVAAPGIAVITSPLSGTLVNALSVTVSYSLDGKTLSTMFDLTDGENILVIDSVVNTAVTIPDTVMVVLDTVPPETPVFTSAGGVTGMRQPEWKWVSPDSGKTIVLFIHENDTLHIDTVDLMQYVPPLALSPDGLYTLTIRLMDAAGNSSDTVSQSFVVDTQGPLPPHISGTTPTNNTKPSWNWSSGGSIDGAGLYQYRLDAEAYGSETTATEYVHGTDLPNGFYTLHVWEKDHAGNWSVPDSFTVEVNTSVPSAPVFVDGGTSHRYSNDATPAWSWASGGGRGTFLYRLTLNDSVIFTSGETTVLSYTADSLEDGNYALFVKEKNAAGTWSGEVSRYVTVDTKAPVVVITSPGTGLLTSSSNIKVSWTMDGSVQPADTTQTLDKEGLNLIIRFVTDEAGNTGADTVEVIRDSQGPNAPSVSGATPVNTSMIWSWTSGGEGSGDYRYRIGTSANWIATRETGYSVSMETGSYTLYVQESDSAGNWSLSGSHTIVTDKISPVVEIAVSSPYQQEAEESFINPSAIATDNIDPSPACCTVTGTVDTTQTSGSQTLTYKATDEAGNTGTAFLNVEVRDTKKPVITVTPVLDTITQFDSYNVLAGVTGTDGFEGDLTSSIVASPVFINTSTAGDYPISYNLEDGSGNSAVTKNRSVIVKPAYILSVTNDGRGTSSPTIPDTSIPGTAIDISASPGSMAKFVHWTVVIGTATFGDRTSSSTTVSLSSNATVQAVFWACGDVLVGNDDEYNTVHIGAQCWMSENLNEDLDSSSCPGVSQSYTEDPSLCATYGRLYKIEAALVACPDGWSLPSKTQWETLVNLSDTQNQAKYLKETGTTHWESESGATNSTGFSAWGAGTRTIDKFWYINTQGSYWTSTDGDFNGYHGSVYMNSSDNDFNWHESLKDRSWNAVRCIWEP